MLGFDFEGATAINRLNNDFEIVCQVGSGGFSSVYQVRNKLDRKQYALKIVKIKPSSYKSDIFDYIEKVVGEAKLLSALNHPNILRYHGCWIDGEQKDEEEKENGFQQQDDSTEMEMYIEESQDSCGIGFQANSIPQKKQSSTHRVTLEPNEESIFSSKLSKYKQVRVYILSQLAETSLQKYISQRNKNLSRNFDKHTKKYSSQKSPNPSNISPPSDQSSFKTMRIENYYFILDILESLIYIHDQKIIHRDIKLQNIILDKNKNCKLIDFGLAKRIRAMKSIQLDRWFSEESKSQMEEELFEYQYYEEQDEAELSNEKHSINVGTKIFSSPEQSSSDNYDERTDIYSLAMAIALMFSHPSTVHEERQLLHQIRNKKLDNIEIDEKLKQLLQKCLSQQKFRPSLIQIKKVIKDLLRRELIGTKEAQKNKLKRIRGNKRQPLIENLKIKYQYNHLVKEHEKNEVNEEIIAAKQ